MHNNIKKAFTLVEMLIVAVLASMILTITITVYFHMSKIKMEIGMKQALIKGTYDIVEKLNITIRDYTLDYEEYFNRMVVGCDSNAWDNFSWDVDDSVNNGHCDKFTKYGNSDRWNNNWGLYYCSSLVSENSPNKIIKTWNTDDIKNWKWCWNEAGWINKPQSFGEYKWQFWDAMTDQDNKDGCLLDDDDNDYGIWPMAIKDPNNVKELYLISSDGKKRIFIRRKLKKTEAFGANGNSVNWDLYSLEILKLRWFDAGEQHDFTNGSGVYDGVIDTWACDYGEGFECNWTTISWYSRYNMPSDENDGWAPLTNNDITITDWNMQLYPTTNAEYYWSTGSMQINPYIKIKLKTKIYPENWTKFVNPELLSWYQLDLQTTFNLWLY